MSWKSTEPLVTNVLQGVMTIMTALQETVVMLIVKSVKVTVVVTPH